MLECWWGEGGERRCPDLWPLLELLSLLSVIENKGVQVLGASDLELGDVGGGLGSLRLGGGSGGVGRLDSSLLDSGEGSVLPSRDLEELFDVSDLLRLEIEMSAEYLL